MLPADIKEGETRTLIISSPDEKFINILKEKFEEIQNNENKIEVGEMFFSTGELKIIQPKINKKSTLITGTPIIVRIPKNKYKKYGIESEYNYIYWRPKWPFDPLPKQLEENLM